MVGGHVDRVAFDDILAIRDVDLGRHVTALGDVLHADDRIQARPEIDCCRIMVRDLDVADENRPGLEIDDARGTGIVIQFDRMVA